MKTTQRIIKRFVDILASTLLLALALPLLALFALLIRATSKGPALFRQTRIGKNGKPFTMLKLRTMYRGAPDIRNFDTTTFNAADDPRVTRIGKFLRTTSCDELPQLVNVLLGTMSLVGPRPELPAQVHCCTRDEITRLKVRPGIAGLAVSQGRNAVPIHRRRELDAQYAESWTLLLDLKILIKTAIIALQARGVHRPNANRLPGFYLDANGNSRL